MKLGEYLSLDIRVSASKTIDSLNRHAKIAIDVLLGFSTKRISYSCLDAKTSARRATFSCADMAFMLKRAPDTNGPVPGR